MKTTEKTPLPPVAKQLPSTPLPLNQSGLRVEILAGENRRVIGSERVTESDLQEPYREAWRENRLNRGILESSPEDLPVGIRMIGEEGGGLHCKGYAITMPGGTEDELTEQVFSTRSLNFVAERAARELQEKKILQDDEQYYYRLKYSPEPVPDFPEDDSGMTITVQKPPLSFLSGSLQPLLEKSTPVDVSPGFTGHENAFPVFYTEEAFQKTEQFSRKGAEINPLFESGCILAGSLGYSPDGGLFVVVHEAYEVKDADQTEYSLSYTGSDWKRIMNFTATRQKKQPYFRILGQGHGHNFLPNNGECCEACATREFCTLHNQFTSAADREWNRAVFQHSPWALCHIFGLTARGDRINGLYTLHDGRLTLRGFRLLPEFNPDDFSVITTE